jgi:HSP20 family molecular chaperone IbpA
MKHLLLATLLISGGTIAHQAHQSYQNNLYDDNFNNNMNSALGQQFYQLNNAMDSLKNQRDFEVQTEKYFNDENNHYVIAIEVSELTEDNLEVETEDGIIYIDGRVQKTEKSKSGYSSSVKQFSQSFPLPADADADIENIKIGYFGGILNIYIPKLDLEKTTTKQDKEAKKDKKDKTSKATNK